MSSSDPLPYQGNNDWPGIGTTLTLHPPVSDFFSSPDNYRPGRGLVAAVNTALLLGQPLLVSGEPGTGKTRLAYHVARRLGLLKPIKFEVKSCTESKDLFYTVDHVRQFSDCHMARDRSELNPADYVAFQALGLAVLRAADQRSVTVLESKFRHDENKDLWPDDKTSLTFPHRSVVLVDEIDKAPRDVPNDILNEIEHLYFNVPELKPVLGQNTQIRAQKACKPIVIFTSNSEKSLPAAFLRRCIYYNIEFPDQGDLEKIVKLQLGRLSKGKEGLINDVLTFVYDYLRDGEFPLSDKPGTAEVLGFLLALYRQGVDQDATLEQCFDRAMDASGVLAKNHNDLNQVKKLLNEYCRE